MKTTRSPQGPLWFLIFLPWKRRWKLEYLTRNTEQERLQRKKDLAAKELEENEKKADEDRLRFVLVVTDEEIKQNLEKLKIKAKANNEAYKKSQDLRAADAKVAKKAQKKLHSHINLCNEFKGIK